MKKEINCKLYDHFLKNNRQLYAITEITFFPRFKNEYIKKLIMTHHFHIFLGLCPSCTQTEMKNFSEIIIIN